VRRMQKRNSAILASGLAVGVAVFAIQQAGPVTAHERYKNGCDDCHGRFLDSTSPQGTVFPAGSKHAMHANFMATNCNLCHRADDEWNPFTGSSTGTEHNPPVGCTGCHGRDYGPDIGSSGVGLRAHHALAGVDECATCHEQDPDPLPESIAPIYYGTPDTVADDACNKAPGNLENWSLGDMLGLDNDGDGLYDGHDSDCCPGDIDLDGDVDIEDFGLFAGSMAGPDQSEPPPDVDPAHFAKADHDSDSDVDLANFADFQRRFGDTFE